MREVQETQAAFQQSRQLLNQIHNIKDDNKIKQTSKDDNQSKPSVTVATIPREKESIEKFDEDLTQRDIDRHPIHSNLFTMVSTLS